MTTVKEKYGYLPTSVWNLKKGSSLRMIIGDSHGELPPRRSSNAKYLPGLKQSSFNPDLAKRVIEYWSESGDTIVDPFAGHSTRMLVTRICGRHYIGFEIGAVAYNSLLESLKQRQLGLLEKDTTTDIKLENGCIMNSQANNSADLIFTCPPFWNLESYEDVLDELSHSKSYDEFLGKIQLASNNCYRVLKEGKYMVWVVADFRKDGFRIFHRDCLNIFEQSGFTIWDIIINVLQSPFAWAQIGKCEQHKYTSKIHEYIIVARKPVNSRS